MGWYFINIKGMKKVEEIVGKVFGIASAKVKNNTSPKNTPAWDSFNGLALATELEKSFSITFRVEEIVAVRNVGDIKKVLRKHGVKV